MAELDIPDGNASERRDQGRFSLSLTVRVKRSSAPDAEFQMINVSQTGALLTGDAELHNGEIATLEWGNPVETIASEIVWAGDGAFGCRFERPLNTTELAAVRMMGQRSPAGSDQGPGSRILDLGHVLKKLREKHGMTASGLAENLGVSRPTVWAWETNRSLPTKKHLLALEEVFEVRLIDFIEGRSSLRLGKQPASDASIHDRIEEAKRNLAAELSLPLENIKIDLTF